MKIVAVDPLVVKLRLDTILERISRLKEIEQMTEKQFLLDQTMQSAAERNLQIIAQAMIDICTHLVAHNHWGSPETYSDAVRIISNHNIIEINLADRLIDFVKLRNVLVHLYLDIDLKIVYRCALAAITDAILFTDAIYKLIKT